MGKEKLMIARSVPFMIISSWLETGASSSASGAAGSAGVLGGGVALSSILQCVSVNLS